MSITNYTYNPFTFQNYFRGLPEVYKPQHMLTLRSIDSKFDEQSMQSLQDATSHTGMGLGNIIDTVV